MTERKLLPVRTFFRRLVRNERGSFIVEGTLTLPLIFLCMVAVLAVSLLAYRKADLDLHAYEVSERAAYVWKDSHKNPVTGAFSYENMDDVYTKAAASGIGWITSLFRGTQQALVSFPDGGGSGPQLYRSRLARAANKLDSETNGTLGYNDRLFEKEISASLRRDGPDQPVTIPFIRSEILQAKAGSFVSDPVEFLRTVDLIQTYAGRIRDLFKRSPSETENQLDGLIPEREPEPVINSEREAKAYLQRTIGGMSKVVQTRYGERRIDVLDRDGLMHEVKYTVNRSDAMDQIRKDMELIRTGEVKGVVWHFFPLSKTGKADLPASLRKELERNGIIWIVHRRGAASG